MLPSLMMNPMLGGNPGLGGSGFPGMGMESAALGRLNPTGMAGMGMEGMMGIGGMAMMAEQIVGGLVGMLSSLMMNGGGQQQLGGLGGADALGGAGGYGGGGGLNTGGEAGGYDGGAGDAGGDSAGGDIMMGSGTPNSGGSGAAQLAQSMVGRAAGSLSFQNYSHAGGATNDCADFVSGIVADTEGFHKSGGDAMVTTFQSDLQKQGWVRVSKSQCQPGDVAIILGNAQHAELCTQAGGGQFIGANGDATETVGRDNLNWAQGVTYWHKPG